MSGAPAAPQPFGIGLLGYLRISNHLRACQTPIRAMAPARICSTQNLRGSRSRFSSALKFCGAATETSELLQSTRD